MELGQTFILMGARCLPTMGAMSIDDAWVTPMTLLRPSSFGRGDPRPRACLVVRFDGGHDLREAVTRGLLGQGWQLVAAPVGEFEPLTVPLVRVYLPEDGSVSIKDGDETVFDGPLPAEAGLLGASWMALARGVGEVIVMLTVGSRPVREDHYLNEIARAGRLLGVGGRLHPGS